MTKTTHTEPVVISAETSPTKENIVERKTIVYEAHIDPTVIRVSGEKLKQQLFMKYGLFKPKAEEIQFVSYDKYYEPYVVVSGKYFIDYYRKCTYLVKVDEEVKEVVLFEYKFLPEASMANKKDRIIRINGEERLTKEAKAFLVLDPKGKDAVLNRLPSAPSEKHPKDAIEKYGIQELEENADIGFVRERIAKRPENLSRIVEEVFEISERSVIYTPRFKLLFRNLKTGEEKVLVLDGVTSEKIA